MRRLLPSALTLLLCACPPTPPTEGCANDSECASAERCLAGRCLPRACGDRPCRSGEACVDGLCRAEACLDVTCPGGESCARGRCYPVECGQESCSLGDVCVDQRCNEPSCVGVSCEAGEACAAGRCRPTACAGVVCADGDVCEGGSCVSTRCVGVVCPSAAVCADGRCVPTACDGVQCPSGLACLEGSCVDPACVNRTCQTGFRCEGGACRACAGSETDCKDGQDDDCDGAIDCADDDCEGLPCGSASFCRAGECLTPQEPDAGVVAPDGGAVDAGCPSSKRDCGGACIPATGCCAPSECGAAADDCVSNVCRCGGAAACPEAEVCTGGACRAGCVVGGQFQASGAPDPSNACRSCQPAVATGVFSPRADGEECGAGQVCVQAACKRGCWIDGTYRTSGEVNPANAYQACIPERSTTAWTDSAPVPDGWFAKATPTASRCGITSAAGTSACSTAFGAQWTWPDVGLGLHGSAYEAAKRQASSGALEFFVYGTDAVPGYYSVTLDSRSGTALRGSSFPCPADRKLLCARSAHSPFRATGPAHFAGSTAAFDSSAGRLAVFFVADGPSGNRELRLQLLTREGALAGGPVTLSSGFGDLNAPGDAPRVHADFEPADHRYRLVYSKGLEANGKYALYAMTLGQDGAVVLPERVVESGTYDLNNAFDVAVDRTNRRYLVAYAFSDLTTYAVRARYIGRTDDIGAAFDLETGNFNLSTLAATFVAQAQRFLVAYPSKAGGSLTVKTFDTGTTTASTGTVGTWSGSRLRLAAGPSTDTALLAYASPATGDVHTLLVNSTGAASGSPLRINAFLGEASSVRGLEVGFDVTTRRYLVAYDSFVQALTATNAKTISLVEEAIAGGQTASGIVQAVAFDAGRGTAAILHRRDEAGAGLLFTLRQDNFDVD